MILRYSLNSSDTDSSGSIPSVLTVETYPTTLAPGSRHTVSFHDRENSVVSCFVQYSRQFGLLKQSSSESQAPWEGCLVIHQKGRKMSTVGSSGATSKTLH